MAYPEDLLEQSEHLARRERKRPKQASLRRAISTAYYSLFHLLISEATRNWKQPSARMSLARIFEHAAMGRACASKRDELGRYLKTKPVASRQLEISVALHSLADIFVQALQDRQSADYDGSKEWTRAGVMAKIADVKQAFDAWKSIRDEPEAQNFLVTLLIKDRKQR